jgi:phosphoenolpyruvate synthase/pyruvate phosphate dikinase
MHLSGRVMLRAGVSSGRARGTARVIPHPDESARLLPGDILVAPSTDPGWTPLFLRASAVVLEVGGYLSHGAIVAREYGLPAVVNVAGALTAVQDGQTLEVDGNTVEVILEA